MELKIKVKMELIVEDHVLPVKLAKMNFKIKVKMELTVEDHVLLVLCIVYGMIGSWESVLSHVELVQELIREISVLKKPTEELAMDQLRKQKTAKSANAQFIASGMIGS